MTIGKSPTSANRILVLASVVFFFSLFLSALVQYQPAFYVAWFDDFAAASGIGEVHFPVFIVSSGLIISTVFFLLKNPNEILSDLTGFGKTFGSGFAIFFTLILILPLRMVDNNSGFVQIPNGGPLSWFLFLLDGLRGLSVFMIFLSCLKARETQGEEVLAKFDEFDTFSGSSIAAKCRSHSEETPDLAQPPGVVREASSLDFFCPPGPIGNIERATEITEISLRSLFPPAWIPRVAFFALLLMVSVQQFVLMNIPHVQDEVAQDWFARLIASGRIHAPEIPCRESFLPWGLEDNGKWLFTSFQPGFSIILSFFSRFSISGWTNQFFWMISLVLFYFLIRRTHGELISSYVSFFFILSPFVIIMASGRMNHVYGVFLLICCLHGIYWFHKGSPLTGAILCGLAGGITLMTRRVEAAAMIGSVLIAIFFARNRLREKASFSAIFLIIAAGIFQVQVSLNRAHSGDPMQMIRFAQSVATGWRDIPFSALIHNTIDNILGFNLFAFGGIIPGFIGFCFLKPLEKNDGGTMERFLAIHAFLVVAAYGTYNYQDYCYGPRFLFPLMPGACLGAGCMLSRFQGYFSHDSIRRWLFLSLGIAFFLTVNQIWALLGNSFWHVDPGFSEFVGRSVREPSIVFLRNSTRVRLEVGRILSQRGFSGAEIRETIGIDTLDYDGFREDLMLKPQLSKTEALEIFESWRKKARYSATTDFDINETEVIRLNTYDPLSQKIVFALDLGDRPNQDLIDRLPNHVPLIAAKRSRDFSLLPYTRVGLENFR